MSEKTFRTVTVVPPDPSENGISLTMGTKVLDEDGNELGPVYAVRLQAEVNSLWTGEIKVYPKVGVMKGMRVEIIQGKASWWRTLLCRMAGVMVDKSSLYDSERTYERP